MKKNVLDEHETKYEPFINRYRRATGGDIDPNKKSCTLKMMVSRFGFVLHFIFKKRYQMNRFHYCTVHYWPSFKLGFSECLKTLNSLLQI